MNPNILNTSCDDLKSSLSFVTDLTQLHGLMKHCPASRPTMRKIIHARIRRLEKGRVTDERRGKGWRVNRSNLVLKRANEAAESIQAAIKVSDSLPSWAEDLRVKLEALEKSLWEVAEVVDSPRIQDLITRIRRMHELRRMLEMGAFNIDVRNAMDAAWKELP